MMATVEIKFALTYSYSHSSPNQPVTHTPADSYSYAIRVATTADVHAIAQIITESFHSPHGFWGWTYPLISLGISEDLRSRLRSPSPHQVCLVAVETATTGEQLVGTVEITLRLQNLGGLSKRFPYLSNLAVRPQYRRRNAAKQMLMRCEQISLSWGFQDLYLHVLEDNHPARQLYSRLGYRFEQVEQNWCNLWMMRSRQILLHKHLQID